MSEEVDSAAAGTAETSETPADTPPVDLDGYQRLVEKLREENRSLKSDRTPQDEKDARAIARLKQQLKEGDPAAKAAAADQARQELAQAVGRAAGLIKDDAAADPAKLVEQMTAEVRQMRVSLAVHQAAPTVGADPNGLLDSRAFMDKAAALDPTDTAGIASLITETVAANPRMAVATVQPPMQRNPAQGASASPPLGLQEQIAAATKAGDIREAIRLKSRQALLPTT